MSEKIKQKPEENEQEGISLFQRIGAIAALGLASVYGVGEAADAVSQPMKAEGVQTVEADSQYEAIYENVEGIEDLDPRKVNHYIEERLGKQGESSRYFTVPKKVEDINSLRPGSQFQGGEPWEGLETNNTATEAPEVE